MTKKSLSKNLKNILRKIRTYSRFSSLLVSPKERILVLISVLVRLLPPMLILIWRLSATQQPWSFQELYKTWKTVLTPLWQMMELTKPYSKRRLLVMEISLWLLNLGWVSSRIQSQLITSLTSVTLKHQMLPYNSSMSTATGVMMPETISDIHLQVKLSIMQLPQESF